MANKWPKPACMQVYKNPNFTATNNSLDHQSGHVHHEMHLWDNTSAWIKMPELMMVIINKRSKVNCSLFSGP